MANAAGEATGQQGLQALADRGYYSSRELKACEVSGITTFVPKPMTSSARAEGRYGKQDFIYIASNDTYKCPANERANYRFTTIDKGLNKRASLVADNSIQSG